MAKTKAQLLQEIKENQEKIANEIILSICKIVPGLTATDVEDMLRMSPWRLAEILTDYKLEGVLNKPKVLLLIQFLNEIKPLVDLATVLVKLL